VDYAQPTVEKMNKTRTRAAPRHLPLLLGIAVLVSPLSVGAGQWRYEAQTSAGSGPPVETGEPRAGKPSQASEAQGAADNEAIEALKAEVADSPNDAGLVFRLARAYAARQRPEKALEACIEAAALEPEDPEIRRHCARYAEWAGDLPESRRQFKRLLGLAPDDREALLGAARAHGWSGKLGQASNYYHQYLELYPDNADAWIEYAQVRAWQGNFAAAMEALEEYRGRFGETDRYLEEKARYLAWSDRPREAMEVNGPLLQADPDNYERLYTRTVALAADEQTKRALDSLDDLERLRPDSKDSKLVSRMVHTRTRPSVSAGWHYYDDSDSIEIQGVHADARLPLTPAASLTAGAAYEVLEADAGSGFTAIDGDERVRYDRTWIGGAYRFGPMLAVSGRIGHGDIREAGEFTPYQVALDARPADDLELSLSRRNELYALSPRAVSLGVTREHNEAALNWRPGLRYVMEAEASYAELSDGNEYSELVLAPRRALLRTGKLNADLGAHFIWAAFDRDLDNGYYDPTDYQRYAGSLFGYWKLSEDDGVSLVTTAGFHKDDEMDDYEFGSDIVIELTTGLYEDWMSVVTVDYSDRYQDAGSYDGWNLRMGLTGRF